MVTYFKFYFLWLTVFLVAACGGNKKIQVSGEVDYVGSSNIFISKKPVHYKYSKKIEFPVNPNPEGKFNLSIPIDSAQVLQFNIDDQTYPLIAKPGRDLKLKIRRAQFPLSVDVTGYFQPYDSLLAEYLTREQLLLTEINRQLPTFRKVILQTLFLFIKSVMSWLKNFSITLR